MGQITDYKRKIRIHYNASTLENERSGLEWYKNAHKFALELSMHFSVTIEVTCGVIAALSPNNRWERNKLDAYNLLFEPFISTKCCTFLPQRQKALKIISESPSSDEILTILKGIKTQNFFSNMVNPETSENVTVDMWAFRSVGVDSKSKYIGDVTTAYKEVANELKLKPHQLQAIVWGVVRGSLS